MEEESGEVGHRAGWVGAWPGLEIGCPDFRSGLLFLAAGLWAEGQGPPPGSGGDNPHREERWHIALSRSRRAFWINSPAVVLKSRSTKGPTAGRGGGGSVGSPTPRS